MLLVDFGIAAESYYPLYKYTMLLMTLFYSIGLLLDKNSFIRRKHFSVVLIFVILYIIVVGFRPLSVKFGDTMNYASDYYRIANGSLDVEEIENDPFFYFLMLKASTIMGVQTFFFFMEVLYVVPLILAVYRLRKESVSLLLLFVFGAFSFYSYSVNGIRQGIAGSLIILALTYIDGTNKEKLSCLILSVFAYLFHASSALPLACLAFCYLYRKPKLMFISWIISIVLSLLFGDIITGFFSNIGFDERLSGYINAQDDSSTMALFARTGFRWDFLLYSSVPIILGWYITIYKKIPVDKTYLLLLGTYIYANAFWVLVIRAAYSNRFAYCSWFLYPIVLSYPILKYNIWGKYQRLNTALILISHYLFTFIV